MAVSEEIYSRMNIDPSCRGPLVDAFIDLQHSPSQWMSLTARQVIPLLSFNSSSWFTIVEFLADRFVALRTWDKLQLQFQFYDKMVSYKRKFPDVRNFALARVRGVAGSQVLSRNGVEILISIAAEVAAELVRPSWRNVRSDREDMKPYEPLIEAATAFCLSVADESMTASLSMIGLEDEEEGSNGEED